MQKLSLFPKMLFYVSVEQRCINCTYYLTRRVFHFHLLNKHCADKLKPSKERAELFLILPRHTYNYRQAKQHLKTLV